MDFPLTDTHPGLSHPHSLLPSQGHLVLVTLPIRDYSSLLGLLSLLVVVY
jgi:hypothetical protein